MVARNNRFTPLQTKKLESVGIKSIYDLIILFPYKLDTVKPLKQRSHLDPAQTLYITNSVLIDATKPPGKKFIILKMLINGIEVNINLFAVSKFTLATLKKGTEYQLLLTMSNGFYNIESFAQLSSYVNTTYFILGKAPLDQYLVPRYSKQGILSSKFFENLHSKLIPSDYILDLKGLIPSDSIIPLTIDLAKIHHPSSLADFHKTQTDYLMLRVFLKLSLLKYVSEQNQNHQAIAPILDIEYLKSITSSLPYQLTPSQKQTIWEIIQDITTIDDI